MRKFMLLVLSVCLIGVAINSYADTVTIGKRYFADRSIIMGSLYSSGGKIQVEICIASGLREWYLEFSTEDKWDWKKVENASKAIRKYINKNDDIDPFKMLTKAGLTGVKYKK